MCKGIPPTVEELTDQISIQAFALKFLAERLADASSLAAAGDWLVLAYANGYSSNRDATNAEIETVIQEVQRLAAGKADD